MENEPNEKENVNKRILLKEIYKLSQLKEAYETLFERYKNEYSNSDERRFLLYLKGRFKLRIQKQKDNLKNPQNFFTSEQAYKNTWQTFLELIIEREQERLNEYKYIKNWISEKMNSLSPQSVPKARTKLENPKTFDELFYNTELVKPYIDILKELDPPLIDTDYNFIGKLKGVFCVWIDEMQRQGVVKHYSDRKIFASLIPQKIKRFSIDESMFGKHQSKAESLYRTDIKTKVSKVKLSQKSQ